MQIYVQEFKEFLKAVFEKQAYFSDLSPTNNVEVLDGIKSNATAFTVKASDIPVTINAYDKGANVGFGTGTGNTTRFGARKEIVYTDIDVPYQADWAIHEGIDRHTVNADLDAAVADRLALHAQAKVQAFDMSVAETLRGLDGAHEMTVGALTNESVTALFDQLDTYYTNNEAVGQKVAKVGPALYNAIVNHPLSTTSKNSTVDINGNEVRYFKGFEISKVPENRLGGLAAITYIKGIGKVFTGINTTRTIESEDFDGLALQGAGKYGSFVLGANEKAVVLVSSTPQG